MNIENLFNLVKAEHKAKENVAKEVQRNKEQVVLNFIEPLIEYFTFVNNNFYAKKRSVNFESYSEEDVVIICYATKGTDVRKSMVEFKGQKIKYLCCGEVSVSINQNFECKIHYSDFFNKETETSNRTYLNAESFIKDAMANLLNKLEEQGEGYYRVYEN